MAHVPPGDYVKTDGGVTFSIVGGGGAGTPQRFVFQGEAQSVEPYNARGRVCFRISWQWGQPEFALDLDGSLVEDGTYVFRRAGQVPGKVATREQLCHLRDSGYVVLHGMVARDVVAEALRSVDVLATIAKAGDVGGTWAERHSWDPNVLAVAQAVWPTVRAALGCECPLPRIAQIAVKGPRGAAPLPPGVVPGGAHIDGLHAPDNNVTKGTIGNFTLLVGVALTDARVQNRGNLGVIPGSHAALARSVDAVGVDAAVATLASTDGAGPTARIQRLCPLDALAPHVQLCTERGTAVVAHYQTVHFSAPNVGPDPRVMIYFRVTRPGRDAGPTTATLTRAGLFLELPGLAALPT